MDISLFEKLEHEGVITGETLEKIKAGERERNISVHWDLRTVLYFGVLLFASGLGVLLYKNIDTIGHETLIGLTGLLAAICFLYCFRKAPKFSKGFVVSPNVWFDYILLLGCLLMLAFVGYLQFRYRVFGLRWGLAIFIPMLFLFYIAYHFDHKGVLSLAITNLGAWLGVALEPAKLINTIGDGDLDMVINGAVLGTALHMLMWLTEKYDMKRHFAMVYRVFGVHVMFISLIAGIARFYNWFILWLALGVAFALYHIRWSYRNASFHFLVVSIIYSYVGASVIVVHMFLQLRHSGQLAAYCIILYFIASSIVLVTLLMRLNKKLKKHGRVQ